MKSISEKNPEPNVEEIPNKVEVTLSNDIGRAGKEKGKVIEVTCPSAHDILECGYPVRLNGESYNYEAVRALIERCTNIANPDQAMRDLGGRDLSVLIGAIAGFLL